MLTEVLAAPVWHQVCGFVLLVGVVVVLWTLVFGKATHAQLRKQKKVSLQRVTTQNAEDDLRKFLDDHDWNSEEPQVEGFLSHNKGCKPIIGNADPTSFETDFVTGNFVAMYKVTYDKTQFPHEHVKYQSYFEGKKRIWESRLQVKFKKSMNINDIFFGVECDEYVPDPPRRTMKAIVALLKSFAGKGIYHSVGDDPTDPTILGELEKPVFVMPMWACDQVIVTPEGELAPCIDDHEDIASQGTRRSGRVKKFAKEIASMELGPGPTFTFCTWGVSQWMDVFNWQIQHGLLGKFDVNEFCGRPPLHCMIYALKDKGGKHVASNREMIFHLPFWSSLDRPGEDAVSTLARLNQIAGSVQGEQGVRPTTLLRSRGKGSDHGKSSGWCCTGR